MKAWIVAALVTGFVVVPLMIRKRKVQPKPVPVTDKDIRYAIDEYIAEEEL